MTPSAHLRSRAQQRGLTLIELMVAIAINLVLVLAATLLYLNTRSAQKAVDDRSAVAETGEFALDLLGRELTLAGFYPVMASEPTGAGAAARVGALMTYDQAAGQMVKAGLLPAAYQHGLMGCNDQMISAQTHACAAHAEAAASTSDSLVVAYFTSDAMGLSTGLRADCARDDVAKDGSVARNTLRVGTQPQTAEEVEAGKAASSRGNLGLPPDSPLLIINHYFLRPTTLTREGGGTVSSLALACRGNGQASNGAMGDLTELIRGVEQFVVTYGVRNPAASFSGISPHRYLTAAEVSALTPMNLGDATLTGWQQVLAVRVCLVVRSTEATAAGASITDCGGRSMRLADGGQLKRFERVFSVKNRQGVSAAITGGS